jgi:hypothetical protein
MSLKVGENVVWNAVEGELVLLNADTGTYYALDDVGSDIWRLLTELESVEPVKVRMAEMYEVDTETLSADVDRLVGEFLETCLLVRGPEVV